MSLRFSTVDEFAPFRESLLSLARSHCGLRRGMCFFVALNEAVNNALLHGKSEASEPSVELLAVDEEDALCIGVRSGGQGFSHDLKADPEVFADSSKESGRGIQIIIHVVDEVSIEESGSLVTLRMKKEKPHGNPPSVSV